MSTISTNLPIVCLTIGINHYVAGHKDFPNLAGGVPDANNFNEYLHTKLGVLQENILTLIDQTATRKGMSDGFLWLLNQVMARSGNACAIIFFSGHGVWDATRSDSMLCPSDIEKEIVIDGGRTKKIEGISGSTIFEWLHQLCRAGVRKTTLIMDCCMSSRLVSLGIPNSPSPPSESSSRVVVHNALGFLSGSLPRFTLFASSGRSALSYENAKGRYGLFVSRLLAILREENVKDLTDISLMHRLTLPGQPGSWQIPHCISNCIYGSVFIGHGDEGDPSFVVTSVEDGQCSIVRAGSAEGIQAGSIWSIHKTNLADSQENPALARLEIIKVGLFSSTIKIPHLPTSSPSMTDSIFYSKLVRNADNSISIYCPDNAWLESVIPPAMQTDLSVRIVDDIAESDLVLSLDHGRVRFQRRKQLQMSDSEPLMRESADAEDVTAIRNVVKSSIHFNYHLKRQSPYPFKGVRMELKEVVEEELEDGDRIFRPKQKNLLAQGSATINVREKKRFGVTLYNDSRIPLYPYLFYYDPSQLTITPCYLPPVGGGEDGFTNLVDAPLMPRRKLEIGHNIVNVSPWIFTLPPGETAEVGYMRLFVSTQPAAFDTILKEVSPFLPTMPAKGMAKDKPQQRDGIESLWMVTTATLYLIAS
ncbi:hypothetical protein D9613_009210 [Agrocybe pediades]|uniref:Peptidase C14 caspase domain-containing protein n=1 Tax=Agrocybe pediades TaxID=84607 RepID=A0A8H4R6H6_9AGAR|nr:hypothetical protein D9613_009210 [Agrocybe pediades]